MVTEADNEKSTNRPYPPISNVTALLHRLRSRNLPDQINNEYLRDIGIPEGTIARTLYAMRFLKLINENSEPTEPLRSISVSTDEEYQAVLSGIVKEAYREVFNVIDPAEDTQDKIFNVFRRYTPASQRNRMVAFFLGICREAGIPTLTLQKGRSMSSVKAARQRQVTKKEVVITPQRGKKRLTYPQQTNGIDPAIQGLIQTLPMAGTQLSKERRDQWLAMAEATLKFVYPEVATPSLDEEETVTME